MKHQSMLCGASGAKDLPTKLPTKKKKKKG